MTQYRRRKINKILHASWDLGLRTDLVDWEECNVMLDPFHTERWGSFNHYWGSEYR